MTDAETLLPCPFCGGEALVELNLNMRDCRIWGRKAPWHAHCIKWGCSSRHSSDRDAAIAAWNTRTVAVRDKSLSSSLTDVEQAPVVSREDAQKAKDDIIGVLSDGHGRVIFDMSDDTFKTIRTLLEAAAKETT